MIKTKKGILIVVSGPSGVGKDTIVDLFLENRNDCTVSISATSRALDKGKKRGKTITLFPKTLF